LQNARPSVLRGAPQFAHDAMGAATGGRATAGDVRTRCARPASIIHTAQPNGTSTFRISNPLSSMRTDPTMRTATNAATTTSDQRCIPARATSTLATTIQSALALGAELTMASTMEGAFGVSAGAANSRPAAPQVPAARSAAATAHQLESPLWRIANVTTSGTKPYATTVAATAVMVAIPVGSVTPPATAAASAASAPANAANEPTRSQRRFAVEGPAAPVGIVEVAVTWQRYPPSRGLCSVAAATARGARFIEEGVMRFFLARTLSFSARKLLVSRFALAMTLVAAIIGAGTVGLAAAVTTGV